MVASVQIVLQLKLVQAFQNLDTITDTAPKTQHVQLMAQQQPLVPAVLIQAQPRFPKKVTHMQWMHSLARTLHVQQLAII